ncbi:hypothetical protein G6F21_014668 [Rhizopus arrhizus]|nr:hypothetical protein G6F21_014668 [Rhizopus arrhizus]
MPRARQTVPHSKARARHQYFPLATAPNTARHAPLCRQSPLQPSPDIRSAWPQGFRPGPSRLDQDPGALRRGPISHPPVPFA